MKSLIFSFRNIRRNALRSLPLFAAATVLFTLAFALAFISAGADNAVQTIADGRVSANVTYARLEERGLEEFGIKSDDYYENVIMRQDNFSGVAVVEGIGEFDVTSEIYYTQSGEAPRTFADEYGYLGGKNLYIYGTGATTENSIALTQDILEAWNVSDMQRLIGKKITLLYRYGDKEVKLIDGAVLTGILDKKIKDIAWFENSRIGACFTRLTDEDAGNYIFHSYAKARYITEKLQSAGYETASISRTPSVIEEVRNIGDFAGRVLLLTSCVCLFCYVFLQAVLLRENMRQNAEYVFAMNSMGFTKAQITGILVGENFIVLSAALLTAIPLGLTAYAVAAEIFALLYGVTLSLGAATFFAGAAIALGLSAVMAAVNAATVILTRSKINR